MTQRPLEGFPLAWPVAQRRTAEHRRVDARYIYKMTMARYRDHLMAELGRMGAINVVLSSDLALRRDGLPHADAREPRDPGVAVYFDRADDRGEHLPYVLACDRYQTVRHNIAALAKTVEAFRAIERHGSPSLLQHAMAGFKQLAAHEARQSWWVVLGVDSTTIDAAAVEAAHARLAELHHPDKGGDHDRMAEINDARDRALRDIEGG